MITKIKEIPELELVKGCRARVLHTNNVTIVYWNIQAGSVMPEHQHSNEQTINMISGTFELCLGDSHEKYMIGKGDVVKILGNQKHSGVALSDCFVIDVFYPIREDYRLLSESSEGAR